MKEIEEKIIETLEKIKPMLQEDGGDIEFVKFEDGTAFVRLIGHCACCPYKQTTLKHSIEEIIVSEIPEVNSVEEIDML